jgi:hypothetical protein
MNIVERSREAVRRLPVTSHGDCTLRSLSCCSLYNAMSKRSNICCTLTVYNTGTASALFRSAQSSWLLLSHSVYCSLKEERHRSPTLLNPFCTRRQSWHEGDERKRKKREPEFMKRGSWGTMLVQSCPATAMQAANAKYGAAPTHSWPRH